METWRLTRWRRGGLPGRNGKTSIVRKYKITREPVRFASIFKFFNINMFDSLRNKFSNYRTCSLRFDNEKNMIIEAFTSVTLSFAFNVSERFYTIEACAVPGGVYTTRAELHLEVYRGVYCFWRCLHYRGLSCIWACLHYRGEASATGPELHLDVSAPQKSVLLLEASATGPELHLDVSAL